VNQARRTDLIHVTDILHQAGLVDTSWFTEEMRDRGSDVHVACHFLDEGDLSFESLTPPVLARVRQYQQFLDDVKPEILSIEEQVENAALRYCGTLDRRLRIGGVEGVLDIKGTAILSWHALQLSLYAGCFTQFLRRWNLYLFDDRYKLVEHKDPTDWQTAKAALTLAFWKEKHGNGNGAR